MERHCRPRFSWQPTTGSHDGVPMTRTRLLTALLLTLTCTARAQDVSVASPVAPQDVVQPAPLQPFVATYQVFHGGRELGEATMQLAHLAGERWQIDLGMRGHGLMRITGLNLQQSTLFDTQGATYRPLTQATVKRAFLSSRKTIGVYDWSRHLVR